MNMNKKNKKSKLKNGLVATTTGLGVTALASVGVLIGLHSNYKAPQKQNYFFEELKNLNTNVIEFLSSQDNKDSAFLNRLKYQSDYATQLLINQNSSVSKMVDVRNDLKRDYFVAQASIAKTKDEFKEKIKQFASLVRIEDWQNQKDEITSNELKNLNGDLNNKEVVLQKLYEKIDALLIKQKELSFELESRAWSLHEQILRNESSYSLPEQRSAALSMVLQVLNLLDQPIYSRDNLVSFRNQLTQTLNTISEKQVEFDYKIPGVIENFVRTRGLIKDSQLSDEQKLAALDRIQGYLNILQQDVVIFADTKLEEVEYINKLLNNEVILLADNTKSVAQLQKEILKILDQIINVQTPSQVSVFIKTFVQNIQNQLEKLSLEELITKKITAQNFLSSVRTISKAYDRAALEISNQKALGNLTSKHAQELLKLLDSFNNEELSIFDYLEKIQRIKNRASDSGILVKVFKDALEELRNQVNDSIKRGDKSIAIQVVKLFQDIDKTLQNPQEVQNLNNFFAKESNNLRKLNKKELANLYFKAREIIALDDLKISKKTRNLFEQLNSKAEPLIKEDSTATRSELQYLIPLYIEQFKEAHINDTFADTLLETQNALDQISKNFKQNEDEKNSLIQTTLINVVKDLKKEAEIISINPNLTEEEKEKQLKELTEKTRKIADNSDKFQKLEESLKNIQEALNSTQNMDERIALEKYINKLKQNQKAIQKALENPENDEGLEFLSADIDKNVANFYQAKASFQASLDYGRAIKKLNEVFGSDVVDGKPSPTKIKLANNLDSLRDIIANHENSEEERESSREKLRKIIDIIEVSRELEVANKELLELLKNTKDANYGDFRPNDLFTRAEKVNKNADEFLSKINQDLNITSKEEYQSEVVKVKNEKADLNLGISIALLKATESQLNNLKVINNASKSPFKEINDSIDAFMVPTQALYDKSTQIQSENPKDLAKYDQTQNEINYWENKLRRQIILASKLQEAAKKLQTIDSDKNPSSYNNLLKVILGDKSQNIDSNLINLDDNQTQINAKVASLNTEIQKVLVRSEDEDELVKLKELYSKTDREYRYYDQAVQEFDIQVSEFVKIIEKFDSSRSTLGFLKDQIKNYWNRAKIKKDKIKAEFDAAKEKVQEYKQAFETYKIQNSENEFSIKFRQAVFDKFEKMLFKRENERFNTLASHLLALIPQISLANYKDNFVDNFNALSRKINSIPNFKYKSEVNDSQEEDIANDLKTKLNNLANAIKDSTIGNEQSGIDGITDPAENVIVRNNNSKLNSISSLIDRETFIINELIKAKSEEQQGEDAISSKQFQNIIDALKKYIPITGNNTTKDDIDESIRRLYADFLNNISLKRAKDMLGREISDYKKYIENLIDTNREIDNSIKLLIDNKLDGFSKRTSEVTDKSELIPIERDLSELKFIEPDLIELAKEVKLAETFYTQKSSEQPSSGAQKILEQIKTLYDDVKPKYLNLTLTEMSTKIKDLRDLIQLYKDLNEVETLFNATKSTFEELTYPQGSKTQNGPSEEGLLTPTEGKNQFKSLLDDLQSKIDTAQRSNLLLVKAILPGIDSLIDLQKEKINVYNTIKGDNSYNQFQWNTKDKQQKENYGFDADAINLADIILQSIPNSKTTLTNIKEDIEPGLSSKFKRTKAFYEQRKTQLDILFGSSTGIKTTQYSQLRDESDSNQIASKYGVLAQKGDDFYRQLGNRLKAATSEKEMEDTINRAQNMNTLFQRYKNIAILVSEGKAKIQNVQSKDDAIKNNKNITKSIELLNNEITQDEKYYFNEQNTTTLDNAIAKLRAFIGRFDLAESVATKTNEINKISSTPAETPYLTESAKKPLIAILDGIFKGLENEPNRENINEYNRLKSVFVEGSSDSSVSTALNNSLALEQKVFLANKYLSSFQENKGSDANYETAKMTKFYDDLKNKIQEANNTLNNLEHNELRKTAISKEIFDGFSGLIDQLVNTKNSEISDRYLLDLTLEKFMLVRYPDSGTTPRLNDYSEVALQSIKGLKVSNPESIKEANTKIKSANDKYLEQLAKLLQWEVNLYKSSKSKFEPYYNFFKNGEGQLSKDILLKAAGLKENILTIFENSMVNPSQENNSAAYNAKTNVEEMKDYTMLQQFKDKVKSIMEDPSKNIKTILEEISEQSAISNVLFDTNIQNISVPKASTNKNQYQRFTQQFEDQSTSINILTVLKKIKQESSLQTKIQAYKTAAITLQSKNINQAEVENIDYSNPISQENSTKRQTYYTQYSDFIKSLSEASTKMESLVFGDNVQDLNNLKIIINKFLNGNDGFVGRSNIEEFLKLIAGPAGDNQFQLVKQEYKKVSKIAEATNVTAQALDNNTSSVFDINNNLSRAYVAFERLWTWFDTSSNTDLFFEYLRKVDSGTLNYTKIIAKNTTSGEMFKNAIDTTLQSEQDLIINGTQYKVKKLNGAFGQNQPLNNLFEKFNILLGENANIFNDQNINVYVYKGQSEESYVNLALTTDPSIKTGSINLYIEYKKPASLNSGNSAFDSVESFGIQFPSVVIDFKTRERYTITKEHIKDTTEINKPLFTTQDAGWNNIQAPINLMGAFVKYSAVEMKNKNLQYFTEDITKNISDQDQGDKTTSTPEFRVKVKLSQPLDGWTQTGDQIYWKTLTPNLAGSSGFAYQKEEGNNKYLYSTIGSSKVNEYKQHTYLYDESNDSNKVILILPLVIAIPVEKDNKKAVLILDWKMLSRFDEGTNTEVPNGITTWYNEKLTEAWLVEPAEGQNQYDNDIEGLATHVLSRIRIRDFVFISWDALTGTWEKDTTVSAKQLSGKSIGTTDFYNSIGENGKFDIDFKLH